MMDRETFERADPLIDDIAEIVDELLNSEKANELKSKLAELGQIVGSQYSVTLDCRLDVFDEERGRGITWLSTGLSTSQDGEPYRTSGDSTPQRYIVKGDMVVVPHDRCPVCWGTWDFKLLHADANCQQCDAALGEEVKVLLDDDVCPHCERGTISMHQPKCMECGFEIDVRHVVWG